MADFTHIGLQSGCLLRISAATPAMCGVAIEVPDSASYRLPLWFAGETAAMTSTPGAMMSGLSRPPPLDFDGPRLENDATAGASTVIAVAGRERRRRGGGCRHVRLDGRPGHLVDVHRRHEVEVGVERVGRRVVEDHADAAGVADRLALVDPGVDAALAEHDLAGDLGRVEGAGDAELGVGDGGSGDHGARPSRSAARSGPRRRGRPRCRWRRCRG